MAVLVWQHRMSWAVRWVTRVGPCGGPCALGRAVGCASWAVRCTEPLPLVPLQTRLYSSAWPCCSGAVALGAHWVLCTPPSSKRLPGGRRWVSLSAPMPRCFASSDGPSSATCVLSASTRRMPRVVAPPRRCRLCAGRQSCLQRPRNKNPLGHGDLVAACVTLWTRSLVAASVTQWTRSLVAACVTQWTWSLRVLRDTGVLGRCAALVHVKLADCIV